MYFHMNNFLRCYNWFHAIKAGWCNAPKNTRNSLGRTKITFSKIISAFGKKSAQTAYFPHERHFTKIMNFALVVEANLFHFDGFFYETIHIHKPKFATETKNVRAYRVHQKLIEKICMNMSVRLIIFFRVLLYLKLKKNINSNGIWEDDILTQIMGLESSNKLVQNI